MEHLAALGTFFGGLGLLLLSCAAFWYCALYQKFIEKDD